MTNLFVLAAFIAAALFAWLSLRLRGNKNIYLRWIGTGLTGLSALALTLLGVRRRGTLQRAVFAQRAGA